MNARLPLLLAASLSLQAVSASAWDFTLRDGLRGSTMGNAMGGAFSAEGWTVTTKEDAIWYAVPRLGEGYVEFTVSGISRANLPLSDHEIFSMYEAGYGISEPIRYAPEFRENHYKCLLRIFGVPETPRIGQQKLMWGMCPSGAPGYGSCGCGSFFDEPFGGDGNWDGTPQRMRIEWGSGQTRLLRNGAQAVVVRWASSGLQFGPDTLHLMLGSSRNRAVADSGMPIGARFSDLVVEGNMTARAVCTTPMDSGVAPTDSGVGVDSAACSASAAPTIAGYIPSATSGTQAVFRATYAHCAGASAIRVAQLWVGPMPAAGANSVSVAYEAGRLSLDGQSCAPGEARVLAGTHGSLDCARTTVTDAGTTRLITWALTMSPATLGGAQGVFADAKANTAMPEPRLGWTRLGDFDVRVDVPAMDGGATSDASANDATVTDVADASRRDAGGGATVEGGCGCRAAGTRRSRGALASLGLIALAFALARRGRSRRS